MEQIIDANNIYHNIMVSVSTSDIVDLEVEILVTEERDFYIETGTNHSLVVSPSQPEYVYYKFTEADTDSIIIEIDSEDDVCLTVSVQDSTVSICNAGYSNSVFFMIRECRLHTHAI